MEPLSYLLSETQCFNLCLFTASPKSLLSLDWTINPYCTNTHLPNFIR